MRFQKGFLGPAPVEAPADVPVRTIGDVEKILIAAKEEVQRGWIQGELRSFSGVCAIGAVDVVYYRIAPKARTPALDILKRSLPMRWRILAVASSGGDRHAAIAGFNDAPWRRRARVERLYNKAIAKAHRQGI